MGNKVIIQNSETEKSLLENGFAVIPLLDASTIAEIYRIYEEDFTKDLPEVTTIFGLDHCPAERRAKIYNELKPILEPKLQGIFKNFLVGFAQFIVKKPGEDGLVGMHLHPSLMINEHENPLYHIWCPLIYVDENNGAMQVVRGSHLFFPPVHGKTIPSAFSNVQQEIDAMKECVRMKAGEGLIFDNRTLHCTLPNNTNTVRVSVFMSVITPEAEFITLYKDPKNQNSPIEVYSQNNDWMTDPLWADTFDKPLTGKFIGTLDYQVSLPTKEEFQEILSRRKAPRQYQYKISAS